MHELSITMNILSIVEEECLKAGCGRVDADLRSFSLDQHIIRVNRMVLPHTELLRVVGKFPIVGRVRDQGNSNPDSLEIGRWDRGRFFVPRQCTGYPWMDEPVDKRCYRIQVNWNGL